jgi:hypothetical protein
MRTARQSRPNDQAATAVADEPILKSELQALQRNLAQARRAARLMALRAQAEALRAACRGRHGAARPLRQAAAELKVRAERKLGRWLADHVGRGGDHRSPARSRSLLRRLGIDRHQSSRWQQIASLPDADFEALAQQARHSGRELTAAAALRAADPLSAVPAAPRPPRPAASAAAWSEGEADRFQRLAEIHRHSRQLAALLAPAFDGQPVRVRPEAWRQIERLVQEIGEQSAAEGRR